MRSRCLEPTHNHLNFTSVTQSSDTSLLHCSLALFCQPHVGKERAQGASATPPTLCIIHPSHHSDRPQEVDLPWQVGLLFCARRFLHSRPIGGGVGVLGPSSKSPLRVAVPPPPSFTHGITDAEIAPDLQAALSWALPVDCRNHIVPGALLASPHSQKNSLDRVYRPNFLNFCIPVSDLFSSFPSSNQPPPPLLGFFLSRPCKLCLQV